MATMEIPDPTSIDWANIAGWIGGGVTVLTSIGYAIWRAIKNAGRIADRLPPATIDTKIMTADTVAMDRLAGTIEASSLILTENNILRREEHSDRAANRTSLEANTAAMDRVLIAINEARQDIRDLTREIVRSNK